MSYWKKEIDNIAQWMREYNEQAGTKGFVIGLSGGIDSAVSACLAVRAVGKENVIGISLPCQTRIDMEDDAKKLAENLDIRLETIRLWESFKYVASDVNRIFESDNKQLINANIKARLRMTALYGVAGATSFLVAGTGNKSELDCGYFTKFGDGGVDLEPLGNYYKTEVYKMAELMPEIPDSIKTKAPSADLWQGQTDEQELGMSYDELDEILKVFDPNIYTDQTEISADKIDKVYKMIKKAYHKNNMPPRCPNNNMKRKYYY